MRVPFTNSYVCSDLGFVAKCSQAVAVVGCMIELYPTDGGAEADWPKVSFHRFLRFSEGRFERFFPSKLQVCSQSFDVIMATQTFLAVFLGGGILHRGQDTRS